MDKLKPILAQKFWILSGLCLLLPLTGWWMATAAMSSEYTARVETLKKAFSGIPQPGPNKNWTDRVLALNTEEERKVKATGEYLWNQQLSLMTWPDNIAPEVEKAGYRGEIAARTRSEYRYAYELELVALHQIPIPFDPLTGQGMVEFPIELIPTMAWGKSVIAPSSQQMWDSQEDIWMYRTLLQGVRNLNEQFGSKNLVESKIKQIVYIELRGGTPGGAAAAAEAAAAAAGAAGAGMEGMAGGAGMMGGPGGMGGPGMSAVLGSAGGNDGLKASFDPAEQFGSDDVPMAGPEGGDPAMAAAGAPPAAALPEGMMGGPGMMGARGGSVTKKRYIEETARFKTRGFYMEVVMDHRCMPEFIAELSDSKWPLRVIRVQSVDLNLDDIGPSNVVGGGMAGMGMPAGGGRGAAPARARLPEAAGMGMGMGMGRPARPMNNMRGAGDFVGNLQTENTLDIQNAMTDPYLVNVALSGIITLYLPPEQAAVQPGAEGTPGTTPAAPGAVDTTSATPAAATAADATATTPAADGTTPAAAAAATTTAAATTGDPGTAPATPAAGTPAAPGTEPKPPATTPAPAEGAPPAATTTPPPASPTPATPAAPDAAATKS